MKSLARSHGWSYITRLFVLVPLAALGNAACAGDSGSTNWGTGDDGGSTGTTGSTGGTGNTP